MDHPDEVRKQIVLTAAPAAVWRALTDPDQLSAWFGARVSGDLRLGGRASFSWPDGTMREAVTEAAEPCSLLVLRWLPFERDAHGGTRSASATAIRFVLRPHPDGTLLSVVEGSPAGRSQMAGSSA